MKVNELLLKLIENKYYEQKEVILNKVNFFFALNQITGDEYSNLALRIEDIYILKETEEEVVEA